MQQTRSGHSRWRPSLLIWVLSRRNPCRSTRIMGTSHCRFVPTLTLLATLACTYSFDASSRARDAQWLELHDRQDRVVRRTDAAAIRKPLAHFLRAHSTGWVEDPFKGPPGTGIRVTLLNDKAQFLGALEIVDNRLWFFPGPGAWRRQLTADERNTLLAILQPDTWPAT